MNHINQYSRKPLRAWLIGLVSVGCLYVLTACGGGGGGSTSTPTPPPQNLSMKLHSQVSGVATPGLVLQNDGEELVVSGDGLYTFKTPLEEGSSYDVTVKSTPAGHICTVIDGSGTVGTTNPVVNVVCSLTGSAINIGGSVKGLKSGSKVTLYNNNQESVVVTGSSAGVVAFKFKNPVAFNGGYVVTVGVQPSNPSQICTADNSSRKFLTADVTDISVTCSLAVDAHIVSGTVSGLAPGQQVTLRNNDDNPKLITANGAFSFSRKIADLSSYNVTVATQPANQICSVTHGTGAGVNSDVDGVAVICVDKNKVYTVGGTVAGLVPGAQVTLLNNGADPVAVIAGSNGTGSFKFKTPVAEHASYLITVGGQPNLPQPNGQICSPTSKSYAQNDVVANVNNIVFKCSEQRFTIAGTVTGLEPDSEITLYNNGANPVTIHQDGNFTFNAPPVANGGTYDVSITELPFLQSCEVINGFGSVSNTNISSVQITCYPPELDFVVDFDINKGSQLTSRLLKGSDGNLYGTTQKGGSYSNGVIFMVDKNFELITLADFGGANGTEPKAAYSGLIQGSDGYFYGTTLEGGQHGKGTVYMYVPGFSVPNLPITLHSFDGLSGSGTSGGTPYAELVEGKDGKLYGTTSMGGKHGKGTIFRVTVNRQAKTGTLETLYDFDSANGGDTPYAGLIRVADNVFYGTTRWGGTNSAGTIYTLTMNDSQAEVEFVYSFTGAFGEGKDPWAELVMGSDGNFYGTTMQGGASNFGTVYQYNPNTNTVNTLWSFNGVDGADPTGRLIEGGDGKFYGTTKKGGSNGIQGTLFSITPDGSRFNTLYMFGNWALPTAGLTVGSDGNLYGTTFAGGRYGDGSVFRYGAN